MRLSATQRRLIRLMAAGRRLGWFGDNGPELAGTPFWPQKRTVRALIRLGLLEWCEYSNKTQREAGICQLVLTAAGKEAANAAGGEQDDK